jgi:aryl-alcohol dehydrogenase-like predicted oxidoreductase
VWTGSCKGPTTWPGRMVVPARRGLEAADEEGRFDEEAMRLSQAFLEAAEHAVAHRSGVAARKAVATTLGFGDAVPADKSLQEFAVEWLLARPGVTCVLLGCRNTRYVQDAIRLVEAHPPVREFGF